MSKAREFADLIPTLNSITSSLVTVAQQPYLQFEQDIAFSASAPVTASVGTLWTDTTDETAPILKVYNGSVWIEMSGAGGGGGMKTTFLFSGV